MKTLTFQMNPWQSIHGFLFAVMPGVQRVISVHLNERSGVIQADLSDNLSADFNNLSIQEAAVKELIEDLRIGKTAFQWISSEDVPFKPEKKSIGKKRELFDEKYNTVLLLRLKNAVDKKSNLLFITLKMDSANFGLSESSKEFTTETKSAVGAMVFNLVSEYLKEQNLNRLIYLEQISQTQKIVKQLSMLKNQYERSIKERGESHIMFCRQYLENLSGKMKANLTFTENAERKIATYTGEIKMLSRIIEKAAKYAYSISIDVDKLIFLEEWYLDFEIPKPQIKSEISDDKETTSRIEKTVIFLDRLEKAARKLQIDDKKLNGVNLGKACDKPISAPAISDAIYNHKTRIINLFKENPNRWIRIRNGFRPLKRFVES